ncbi:MAG: single-stranded DNA-binding protein [Eggerthellaceae bacterium]|nr:single-stranded DNA-binding protein [Eggerthellaceae bacterium]
MSINRVVISGNLTRDPELRRTQSGMSVMSLGMAVNDRRKNNQTGEWEDYTNFVDCTLFGNRADSLAGILQKGMKVAIEGKLRYSQWEQNGQKRSKLEVVVDEIDLMTQRNAQSGSQGQYQTRPNNYTNQQQNGAYRAPQQPGYVNQQRAPVIDAASSVYDDDIPF